MSNPIPNCFVLNNDSYINEQRFNAGKGIPWQGPKTQLVNPPVAPALLIPAPREHSLGGFLCFVCFSLFYVYIYIYIFGVFVWLLFFDGLVCLLLALA